MINQPSNPPSSLYSFENLPVEVLEYFLSFCTKNDISNLLTLSSKVFPIVAKKIWCKQIVASDFFKPKHDFRRIFFFQNLNHVRKNRITCMLPYLQFITELSLNYLCSRDQVLILKSTPNCKSLSVWWSKRIASTLVNSTEIVPYLSSLTIPDYSELYESNKDADLFLEILEKRASYLVCLIVQKLPFFSYSALSTILTKTKMAYLKCDLYQFRCDKKSKVEEPSEWPLWGSPFLKTCSLVLTNLCPSPPLDFFDWILSSSYLTTLSLTLNFYPSENQGLLYALFYFFKHFPLSSPLKTLILRNWNLYTRTGYIPKLILPSNRMNTSLETLKLQIRYKTKDCSYDSLIKLMQFFPHLKCLEIYYDYYWDEYGSDHQRTSPIRPEAFLRALSSLNLIKLKIDLPNRLQRWILPVLRNMTSLRVLDIRLDVGLLYQFIPQLKQITRFIFRSFRPLQLQVFIHGQYLKLLERKDEQDFYYSFNRDQLELIQNAPMHKNLFKATFL